jgi:hypothetical protein
MKQDIKVFQNSSGLWENFLEWNPQLFREVKGRLKTRNVIIAAGISVITQLVISLSFLGQLPEPIVNPLDNLDQYSRYCFNATPPESGNLSCQRDLLGNWLINWQLLWLDLFIALSIVSIFALLVIGTYMLIADTVKEESRGTLNFIRLTPQSASSILTGKILGVPILLYLVILLALPLQLMAGLGAHIPLSLIFAFDTVIVASCNLFYSAALLWSLMNFGLSGFKPWLASGAVLFSLYVLNQGFFGSMPISNTPFDWLVLFNPAVALAYLTDATYLPSEQINYLEVEELGELLFYGQALWTKASTGIGLILFNFSLCTYWCWSVLKRRFHNPEHTLLSKTQSYWLTGWFVAISLGFTLQSTSGNHLGDNFIILQCFISIFALGLISALSPHRQALHDWARYRHQVKKEGNILWKELVWGENSPSTIAIAINLLIATVYIVPSLLLFPLENEASAIFWGLLLSANILLMYAVVAQLILTVKNRKRAVWSVITILALIVAPPMCLGLLEILPDSVPQMWFFTFVPTVATEYGTLSNVMLAILGQWLVISLAGFQLTRKLKQAGASETKLLFQQ